MAETKFESDRAFTWTLVDPWQLLTKRLGCCRYPLQLIHVGERFDEILQRGWAHQVHQLTAQEAAAELWMDRAVNHVIRFIIRFTQVHLKLYLNLLRRLVVEAGVSLEAQLVFPLFVLRHGQPARRFQHISNRISVTRKICVPPKTTPYLYTSHTFCQHMLPKRV